MLTTKKGAALFSLFQAGILALLLCGCAPSGPRSLLEGDRLLREGKYSESITKFNEAIRLLPVDSQRAEAWNRLGLAYHYLGRDSEAANAYVQALKLDRNLSEARFNLGCLALDKNNLPTAIDNLTSYIVQQQQRRNGDVPPEVWLKLASAELRRAGQLSGRERTAQLENARKILESVAKIKPSAEVWNDLGMIQFQRGHLPDAVTDFNAALKLQPDYSPALLNLAIALQSSRDSGDRRQALQKYREYLSQQPTNAAEVEAVAHRLDTELNPHSATASPETSASADKTTRTATAVTPKTNGELAALESSKAGPRYHYLNPSKPVSGDRNAAKTAFDAGVRAQDRNHLSDAVESYRKAVQSDPSFFEAQYNLGRAEYDLGHLTSALAAYENALAVTSGSVNARYNFALALQKAGYAQDAANELEKLLAQKPEETRAHLLLGVLYAQNLNNAARARMHFSKVLELDPQNPQATAIRSWLAGNH